jgi:hypothetical protein
MSMPKLSNHLLLSSIFALTTAAQAAEPTMRPLRVNVDVGVSSVPRASGREATNSDPVVGVAFGVALDERWSVEVFKRSLSFVAGFLSAEYTPQDHVGIALRGDFPLSERWRAEGWLGVGRTKSTNGLVVSQDRSETEASLGVGMAYSISAAWSLHLATTRFTRSKVTTTLFGGEYRF